jgi:hypothetical protein
MKNKISKSKRPQNFNFALGRARQAETFSQQGDILLFGKYSGRFPA